MLYSTHKEKRKGKERTWSEWRFKRDPPSPLPYSPRDLASVSLPLFPLLLPSPYIIPGHMQNRREKAVGAEITNAQRVDGREKSFVPSAATFF